MSEATSGIFERDPHIVEPVIGTHSRDPLAHAGYELNTASHSRDSLCPRLAMDRPNNEGARDPQERAQATSREGQATSKRGAGKTGCALHPRSRVQTVHQENAHEHTGSAETVRPSLRNGLTTYSALSLVTGLSCHHRPREALASHELDASVGTSGPHDFAVRFNVARPRAKNARRRCRVHCIPRPTFVTIAIRPSCRHGIAGDRQVICLFGQAMTQTRRRKNWIDEAVV